MIAWKMAVYGAVYFEHSNIFLGASLEGVLRKGVVTPPMHMVHHSTARSQADSNYGVIFSFWDRIFRTYGAVADPEGIALGLPQEPIRGAEVMRLPEGAQEVEKASQGRSGTCSEG
ncbi:MAG: sterol desaturase family protein [Elusimicrobia bacterium]|nr:sterol desaturase family protein [Elusimicrobiota bacterium]